jgi:hypothetical protein
MNYYVLKNVNTNEKWFFTTRQRALDFLNLKICWGCRKDVKNKVILEPNPENGKMESIVIQDELDTDCGSKYSIEEVTEQQYKDRANKALDEMTKLWESEYSTETTNANE